jgi:hypothetical protein
VGQQTVESARTVEDEERSKIKSNFAEEGGDGFGISRHTPSRIRTFLHMGFVSVDLHSPRGGRALRACSGIIAHSSTGSSERSRAHCKGAKAYCYHTHEVEDAMRCVRSLSESTKRSARHEECHGDRLTKRSGKASRLPRLAKSEWPDPPEKS